MKKILSTICLLLFTLWLATGQDLIQNTQLGQAASPASEQPNVLAQLIQDRKDQQATFKRVALFQFDLAAQTNEYRENVSKAVFLKLSQAQLAAFWENPSRDIRFEIPVTATQKITLELTQVSIAAPGFKVKTASGRVLTDGFPGLFYRGIVRGNVQSLVTLSIFPDELRILISDNAGAYVLNALKTRENPLAYVLYNERDLTSHLEAFCGTPETASEHPEVHKPSEQGFSVASKCVQIYIESDFQLYNAQNSNVLNVVTYIFSLFHESATIYANEMVSIEISEIFVWDQADPYTGVDCGDVLPKFVANRPTFNGNLAHLISSRSKPLSGGGVSFCGLAFGIGGICGGTSEPGPYCVSTGLSTVVSAFPTYSWNLNVFTHEMGHVMGSWHTHRCVWNGTNTQIDDCGNVTAQAAGNTPEGNSCFDPMKPVTPANGGFIMSYCHQGGSGSFMNFSLGFGQQSGDLIRSTLMSASCVSAQCNCTAFVNRTVNGAPIASAVYLASNSISSSGDANAATNNIVVFRAGSLIELTPGFEATPLFIAEVIPNLCNGPWPAAMGIPDERQETNGINYQKEGDFELFPNPASQSVTLQYQLRQAETITIYLFNSLGSLVETIEDQDQQPAGNFSRQLELTHLAAGMYYVVLQTPQRKMVRYFVLNP
ncbi:MAG: T9SS type A sorting domain-containing protein [Bacteroidetes bacterium]|nr:T9SS type A sorting domain-containing protein [Bacteroidota bacterium]